MAKVRFVVTRELDLPARSVFDELIDWRGHAEWVPLTRVVIESGDGGAGTVFVATSGIGPLALPDRMRVDSLEHDTMSVHVTKIGPVLTGTVELTVTALPSDRCRLDWVEDITVPVLPQFLAPPVAAAARFGFGVSITKMAKRIASRQPRERVSR